jgi:UDP-N-acetylmuramoyl-L-alanyl-D-glutamate--2,6-diaminopimelate ligase
MLLGEVAERLGASLSAEAALGSGAALASSAAQRAVSGVRHDSRAVTPGDVFVAIPGATVDGSAFARDAVARGAVAVVSERDIPEMGAPVLVVRNARAALGPLAHAVYGDPTARMRVAGITGTNGKTTTTWLLEGALEVLGERPALLGTVLTRVCGVEKASAFTTPEADDLARFASDAVAAGATHLSMEVSSHGLALHRVDGVHFEVAAFTNLTQDHLDFHGTLDAYLEAKARLFLELGPSVSVINIDDPAGASLADRVTDHIHGRVLRVSPRGQGRADIRAERADFTREGIVAVLRTPDGVCELRSPLFGAHNLENLLVAFGVLLAMGVSSEAAARALGSQLGAPGRLERVSDPRGVAVLVDYAHSPDALRNVLAALRPLTAGRLIAVFGCGGDRDRTKRPRMGEAVRAGADMAVLTSDNPRTEAPERIVDDVLPGLAGWSKLSAADFAHATSGFAVEPDRGAAIRLALEGARSGDTVLIAGKGHEDYQIVGTQKRPFDDRAEAARAIASLGGP